MILQRLLTIPFISGLLFAGLLNPSATAQTLNGLSTGNYAGVAGITFNPASIVDSRYKFDLNIAAAQVFFSNNFLDADPLLFGARKLFRSPYNESFQHVKKDLLHLREPMTSERVYMKQNSEFQLPLSFMLTTGKRSAIAINLRNRTEIAVNNLNPQTALLLFNELQYPSLHGTPMNNDSLSMQFLNWQEVGFTYGRVIFNAKRHFLKAAVTAKWLGGNAAAYLQADKMDISFANATTLSLQSPQINYARTSRADFDAFNRKDLFNDIQDQQIGFDAGIVYEFRGRINKYRYTDEDEKAQYRRDANKYMLRLGATLNDFGKLQFNRMPLTQNHSANINNWDFGAVRANNIREWDTAYSRQVSFLTNSPDNFSMRLPTALILNADLRLFGGFYVNAAMQKSLPNLGNMKTTTQILTGEWYAITPRFEGRFFGAYVPIIIRNNTTQIGGTIRLGPVYVGSNNLLALVQNSKVPTADIHAGFRIPFGFGKPSKLARKFEKGTGVKVTDEYGDKIDSNRNSISAMEARIAFLEKMTDSVYRQPPTIIINNYIVDSAGSKKIYNEVQTTKGKATATTSATSSTHQPRMTSTGMPEPLTQAEIDSLMKEYQKQLDGAKRNLEYRGIKEPRAKKRQSKTTTGVAAPAPTPAPATQAVPKTKKEEKRAKRQAKNEDAMAKQELKRAKQEAKQSKNMARSNQRYNQAVENELRMMRRQQARNNAVVVGAVGTGVAVSASNQKTDTVILTVRDTVVVEKIVRDTVIIREPAPTPVTTTGVQPDSVSKPTPVSPTILPTTKKLPELRTARIFFANGSATIRKEYTQTLNNAAAWMLQHPESRVLVTGVTDATGSAAQNQRLALQRVNAVIAAMEQRGINRSRFETATQTETGNIRQANSAQRRVDMSAMQ